ncbi:membrane hypothetical protein [Candidatus Zixiibacteriota bacterium]|nr:membrane hypothetical protein [candidate division Zixibacteria bacterium]
MMSPPSKKYPALIALVGVVLGIVAADILGLPSWPYLFAAAGMFLVSFAAAASTRKLLAGATVILGLAFLSAFNYNFRFRAEPPGHISHFVDDNRKYTIYGTIDDWPDLKENRTDIIIRVDSLGRENNLYHTLGRLRLSLGTPSTRFQYGDRIIFEANLYSLKGNRNGSGFDYRRYLNLRGIFAAAYLPNQFSIQIDPVGRHNYRRLIGGIRNEIMETFQADLDSNSAALAGGFLIGETKNIAPRIYTLFRDSGTLHLLAVSGSNVALVVLVFSFLLRGSPLGPQKRTIFLLAVIILFSYLAYNQPSVVRAAVMAGLILLGKLFQRRIDYNNIIAATALVILIFRPTELFDVGFQLSFVTAWGLIFFMPRLSAPFKGLERSWKYKLLILPLSVCLIAQVVSMPLSAYYFNRVPLISFVSNLVIVPLVSLAVVGELLLLLAAMVHPYLALTAGGLLNVLLKLIITILEFFGTFGGTIKFDHQFPGALLILFYIFLVMLSYAIVSRNARKLALIYILIIANGGLIMGLSGRERAFEISVLPISNGYLAIVPSAPPLVILCQMPQREYSLADKVIIPNLNGLGIKKADLAVLSEDYQTVKEAVSLIDSFSIGRVYLPQLTRNRFLDQLQMRGTALKDDRIKFYSRVKYSTADNNSVTLSTHTILVKVDHVEIAFADDDYAGDNYDNPADDKPNLNVLIKPEIGDRDLWFKPNGERRPAESIICNKISGEIKAVLTTDYGSGRSSLPEVREMAQVGAIKIVIRNGRAELSN